MHRIILDERAFGTAGELHAFLQGAFRFPSYYGCNLDALSDCAEDVDGPVCVIVRRDKEKAVEKPWFGKAVRVLKRASQHNPALEVVE